MSTNWFSRKLRRSRQQSPLETYSQLQATRVGHTQSTDQPQSSAYTPARCVSHNRTTVAAKGKNGAKKTVITIRKVYDQPQPVVNAPVKRKPQAVVRPSLKPALKPTQKHEQNESETLNTFGMISHSKAPCQPFGILSSPSTTIKSNCPPLKSPSSSSRSLDSVDSPQTLIAENQLDLWGLPTVTPPLFTEPNTCEFYDNCEPAPLYLYGIGSDPEEMLYYNALPNITAERRSKIDLIRYLATVLLTYKLVRLQQKRKITNANMNARIRSEFQKRFLSENFSLFAYLI